MNITKGQLETAIRGLLSQDKYKSLSAHIGGWFWTTEAVWAVVGTFKTLSSDSLQAMTQTALTVSAQFSDLLAEFVADLFQVLAIIAEEAADIPADAEGFGETPAGQVLLGLLAPEQFLMGRSGVDNRLVQAIAGVLNPIPAAASFGSATAKNVADAGKRVISYRNSKRSGR